MYTALYRTQRPEVFSEVIGQDHIVRILKNQINTGTVSHAYLFCGTRGTGKTTTARILAKAVNCLETEDDEVPCGHCANCMAIKEGIFMDVIEIDAASNNGVENIRELRESVKYPPAVGRKKVYIIDEVHMLSTGAYNALLKTLEEPNPGTVIFLLSENTENLIQTILSRCIIYRMGNYTINENAAEMEVPREVFQMVLDRKYFFEIRDYLTKKVKDRKAAFALLDGLERLYREMLVTDGPCPVREEKIIEGVNYVEEARRDLQANVNYKYAIRNLILKIGG